MKRLPVRAATAALALGVLSLSAAGCGSGEGAPAGSKELAFTLTDAGCEPHDASVAAGPIDFEIENGGTGSVTELEVMDGETILGERENVTEGLDRNFSLTLEEGEYTLRCKGGTEEDGTLKVTGELRGEAGPEVAEAIADYRAYLVDNTEELTARTRPFVAAIVAGEVAKAKALYPEARVPYERIEPVAESFGDLDPRIDARENDVAAGEFGGFHRLEKALWEEGSLQGMAPVAASLMEDVEELEAKVRGVRLQAVQIANGANELLTEVSTSKITGEEERYSHLDLVDFKANVEGSRQAFDDVAPLAQPKLAKEIEADFEAVDAALAPYETGAWPGFVLYAELHEADTRKLAQVIDTLAENLSLVPAEIARDEGAQR